MAWHSEAGQLKRRSKVVIRYQFKEAPLVIKNAKNANPQKIGEALAKIAEQDGGLTPAATVNAARPERHVLHKHFEWDNDIAAELFREDQARGLIRCIRIVDETDDTPKMAFLSI